MLGMAYREVFRLNSRMSSIVLLVVVWRIYKYNQKIVRATKRKTEQFSVFQSQLFFLLRRVNLYFLEARLLE